MKIQRPSMAVAILLVGSAIACAQVHQPYSVAPTRFEYDAYYSQNGDASPSDHEASRAPIVESDGGGDSLEHSVAPYDGATCDPCCSPSGSCLLGDCCLGEPYRIRDCLLGPCCWLDMGGWTQLGYHSDNTRMSTEFNDLGAFNDLPDRLNLHQQWLWFAKAAEAPACGYDWGFRFDILYGTDAQKTQAFGNPRANVRNAGTFDASLDHGSYGWAIPQLYGEVAFGDWSIIAGHFFTLIGYEVVPAPQNFFYSHSYTMFNSEPFTHTGVLATYSGYEDVEFYGGWVLGWDTGFDQAHGGSMFLGGFSTQLADDVSFTYINTAGNFGLRSAGESGYSHSLVLEFALSESLDYVLQSDLVSYDENGDQLASGDQVGINQYLFYTLNDCTALGTRVEWWKSDGISYQEVTYGVNHKLDANLIVRPEVRHNWTNESITAGTEDFNNTVFGIDAILTY